MREIASTSFNFQFIYRVRCTCFRLENLAHEVPNTRHAIGCFARRASLLHLSYEPTDVGGTEIQYTLAIGHVYFLVPTRLYVGARNCSPCVVHITSLTVRVA